MHLSHYLFLCGQSLPVKNILLIFDCAYHKDFLSYLVYIHSWAFLWASVCKK